LALAGCGLLFYTLDWMILRNWVAQGLHVVLSSWGHVSRVEVIDGKVLLVVDGVRFWISAQCTYVDLALCLSPFLWQAGLPTRVNLGNLLLAFVAVQGINFARLVGGHLALARGASWAWAHDLPDLLLWYPVLTLAVLGALRTDQRQARRALLPKVITEEKEAVA
jgi:hypothetical protein